jgi:hypothetical protein
MPIRRLLPEEPLPPYAFVPGQGPHPESDPAGHSFGRQRPRAALDSYRWRECQPYLYGIDLFNAGYYWEAHAEWESLWLEAGRRGPVADFLKGLIQLAAAGVKEREGIPAGRVGHACRAAELWRSLPDVPMAGFFPLTLIALAEACRLTWPAPPPQLVPSEEA